jgi:hypothetical protein
MKFHEGYYSLIQFCPDLSRLEGINIGVLIYSPEEKRVRCRFTKSNRRITQCFGKQDRSYIVGAKSAAKERLQRQVFATKGELAEFINKRANGIQFTELRFLKTADMNNEVDRLFERLVVSEGTSRRIRIDRQLGEKLSEYGVEGLVEKSVNVELPNISESIQVPFAYQNGRFNLIAPVQFSPDGRDLLSKTGERAIEGQLLYETPDPERGKLRLVVVAQFPPLFNDSREEYVKSVLEKHNVQVYNLENLEPLIQDIKKSASLHSGIGAGAN